MIAIEDEEFYICWYLMLLDTYILYILRELFISTYLNEKITGIPLQVERNLKN